MTALFGTFGGFVAAGIAAAVVHALLPNHWLPFLAAARVHGWNRRQLLGFTALVAVAHAFVTLLLGIVMSLVGHGIVHFFHEHAPKVAGTVLMALGVLFLAFPQLYGHRHIHHPGCGHSHLPEHAVTLSGLFVTMALSPCEGLLPIFFAAAVKLGIAAALALAVFTSLVTVMLLISIVMGAQWGWERMFRHLSERHERWLSSGLLLLLGAFMLLGRWH
ncbi:hypothetical protein HRbin17_00745 [bacterium HR17]|jgi:hypothetical protein|uniref:Urease accessory protein UreH-like transmembrane domain-containing protein n=1 Tax=Candidatus Fervidibacter japonicus TaxID=2035412 RepID=A0A2H5XAQ2_9BACT|nr:hypothetical protein HRbin17_00745 [bacterium HR17]